MQAGFIESGVRLALPVERVLHAWPGTTIERARDLTRLAIESRRPLLLTNLTPARAVADARRGQMLLGEDYRAQLEAIGLLARGESLDRRAFAAFTWLPNDQLPVDAIVARGRYGIPGELGNTHYGRAAVIWRPEQYEHLSFAPRMSANVVNAADHAANGLGARPIDQLVDTAVVSVASGADAVPDLTTGSRALRDVLAGPDHEAVRQLAEVLPRGETLVADSTPAGWAALVLEANPNQTVSRAERRALGEAADSHGIPFLQLDRSGRARHDAILGSIASDSRDVLLQLLR